jgi:hypothetical protein
MTRARMGCGAALAWAFGVCAALVTPAAAGGDLVGAPEPAIRGVIVSGGDVTERAHEGYLGAYLALNGDLNREGWVFRLLGTRGSYEYGGGIVNSGDWWQGDVMVGYQWVRGRLDVGVYVGVDYQHYGLQDFDPGNPLRGSETGFKVAVDIESNGRDNSPWYVALNGSYSTAFDTYYALARVGYNFGRFTIGPEGWVLGDVTGDAQRLGAFIKFDLPLGPGNLGSLTFSAGHQFGDDVVFSRGFDDGAYGTVNLTIPFGR